VPLNSGFHSSLRIFRVRRTDEGSLLLYPAVVAFRGNTGTVINFSIGNVALTRVPYFDAALDAEVIGFTAQVSRASTS
jgi:hypothetical protein